VQSGQVVGEQVDQNRVGREPNRSLCRVAQWTRPEIAGSWIKYLCIGPVDQTRLELIGKCCMEDDIQIVN
jgi:hypothetical protein